ncbi:MAG TPA: MMPL family transporter [Thermoanaerobaculia bacterium]|nr:MMPL family transporter [Thermoanaerobaculia bacterium]
MGKPPFWMVRLALRRPVTMLIVWGLALAVALPGLARLKLRTDGRSLVPPKAPAVLIDRQVRQTFGLRDPLLVLVEPADPRGIYNPATLHLLADLTAALGALPGVGPSHVRSLATERGASRYDRVRRDFLPLFEPFPETPERLAQLRKEVSKLDLPVGLLVSADGSAATLLVDVPPAESLESDERFELWRQVDATARRFARPVGGVGHRIAVVGAPAAETLLGRYILDDLRLLVPAAMALVAILLYVALRSRAAAALGLAKVGVCLCVLFGGMGWVEEPIFLSTAILPVILVAVGLADEIHLLARYLELLAEGTPAGPARELTFSELGSAVIVALLTTITGFASFVLAPIPALSHFGVVAAVGVALCLLFSLTATPAVLALVPAERFRTGRRATLALGRGGIAWLADLVAARPRAVLVVLGLVTAALGAGIFRLEVQDSWLEGFSPTSELRRATARLDERFLGSHRLLVAVRFAGPAAPPKPLLDPGVLARMGELEATLRAAPSVGGVLGPYRLVTTVAGIAGGNVRFREIRERPEWNAVLYAQADTFLGAAARREIAADGFAQGIVQVYLRNANYRDTAALLARVRRFERARLAPLGGSLAFAGDIAVSQAMIPAIVDGQFSSFAGALLGSALTVAFGLRRPSAGLASILPALGAILWTFGLMGWLGIPLGVATSMFCAITLGIGDDYAIHFLDRRVRALAEGEAQPTRVALLDSGPAILWDALVIALGFSLLAASQVPVNRRLGILLGLALLAAATVTLSGLSAVFTLREKSSQRQ